MATQTQVIKTAGGNYDTPVGVGGTLNNNTGQVLNSSSLTPSSPIQLPPPPTPTNYNPAIANGNATFAANAPAIAAPAAAPADTNNFDSLFKQYLGSQPAPPSASDIYSTLYKSSGIDQATQDVNDKAAAVKAANSNLNSIQAQLAGLNAEATAAQLNQENRLAPTFAIAGEQGAIDRARAVKALPLQAQALAAQAQVASAQGDQELAQGILKQATDHLDTAFKLQVQDAQAQYQYKQKVLDTVYQYATASEQRRLDAIQRQADKDFQTQKDDIAYQRDIAKIKLEASLKGSGGGTNDPAVVAGWVASIKSGSAKLSDLTGNPALKNAVVTALAQGGTSQSDILATTKKSLDELSAMVNGNTTGSAGQSLASGFTSAVGNPLLGWTAKVAGSPAADFTAKLNQVKNDVILPNLTLLHGLGRVTDREFQALSSAVTDLSTQQSQGAFKRSLADITQQINSKLQDAGAGTDGVSTTASGQPFDYAGAKAAGYTDTEIQAYIAAH